MSGGGGDKYVYASSYGTTAVGPLWRISINLQSHDFSESEPGAYDLDFYVIAETWGDALLLGCATKRGMDYGC